MSDKAMIYPVRATPGRRGEWQVETVDLAGERLRVTNLRARLRAAEEGLPEDTFVVAPGRYTILRRGAEVFMSNTPMEAATNQAFIERAHGRVLITGLGLGMVVDALLAQRAGVNGDVRSITVVEKYPEVVSLVAPLYDAEPRVSVVTADAFTWQPAPPQFFDCIWHDIWPTIGADNLREMRVLEAHYAPMLAAGGWQDCWAQDLCVAQARRVGDHVALNEPPPADDFLVQRALRAQALLDTLQERKRPLSPAEMTGLL